MNPFEGKNIQCRRNDATDSGVGFGVSFGMFALIFLIAIVVEVASK
ncbi:MULTISPECIES: YqzM family protein [unclassified Lysinibacillus]